MKTSKLTASFLLLFTSLFFVNCTKDQNENYMSTTKEFISQGKWSVDYFYSGGDKTAQYSNYQFNFFGNGTVSAKGGVDEFTGTWKMIRDVNRNDVLQINITTQDPHLSELNDQWDVTDKSIDVVAMQDGSNQLRFKKL